MFKNKKLEKIYQEIKSRRNFLITKFGYEHSAISNDFWLNFWYREFENILRHYRKYYKRVGITRSKAKVSPLTK